jgi:hypothetical protein
LSWVQNSIDDEIAYNDTLLAKIWQVELKIKKDDDLPKPVDNDDEADDAED